MLKSMILNEGRSNIFQTLDLNAQILETVAEINGELLWISEMPDSNNWLIGTPNSIFRFDSRMENAKGHFI